MSMLSGHAEQVVVPVFDADGNEVDLTNMTFALVLTPENGDDLIKCEAEPSTNLGELLLYFPALSTGSYAWELSTTSDTGDTVRFAYGTIGVFSTAVEPAPENATALRSFELRLPGAGSRKITAQFRSSLAAEVAADQAEASAETASSAADTAVDAANRAETAVSNAQSILDAAQEALDKLSTLDDLLDDFKNAIATQVKISPTTGCWVVGGIDTGVKAQGDAGKSPVLSSSFTWLVYNDETGQWEDTGIHARGEDGRSPYISNSGTWVTFNDLTGEFEDTGLPAQGEDGIDGSSIVRHLVASYDDIPQSGDTCNGAHYYYVPIEDAGDQELYNVYAWLVEADGSEGWTKVAGTNDIASTRLYGLTKLGTDVTLSSGAPVGTNDAGNMYVGAANTVDFGTLKTSYTGALTDGGKIGTDSNGKALVEPAGYQKYGAVKLSANTQADTSCIGLNDNGEISVRKATLNDFGVVKLGSSHNQNFPRPYLLATSVDQNYALSNNILYGGALKHQSRSTWSGTGMSWFDTVVAENPELFADNPLIFGLQTSSQFEQSQDNGLVLLDATTELTAGVVLATGLDDTRENAVMTASGLKSWLDANMATSSSVYTKSEVDSKVNQLNKNISNAVSGLASQNWVTSKNYVTQSKLNSSLSNVVKTRTPNYPYIAVYSDAQYKNLANKNSNTIYITVADL